MSANKWYNTVEEAVTAAREDDWKLVNELLQGVPNRHWGDYPPNSEERIFAANSLGLRLIDKLHEEYEAQFSRVRR